MIGCTVGAIFTSRFTTEAKYKSYYNITYGNVAVDNATDDRSDINLGFNFMVKVTFGMIVIISLIGISISFIMIYDNLKQEPIALLTSIYKE